MHYFFLEQFCGEAEWFEKRLSYTRSIAVTSMAGYLIGLGDRHLNNMLIDKRTADVIHIDLGIAFEQGRFLSTPELVPFRLTRDIIDGMGITGENQRAGLNHNIPCKLVLRICFQVNDNESVFHQVGCILDWSLGLHS